MKKIVRNILIIIVMSVLPALLVVCMNCNITLAVSPEASFTGGSWSSGDYYFGDMVSHTDFMCGQEGIWLKRYIKPEVLATAKWSTAGINWSKTYYPETDLNEETLWDIANKKTNITSGSLYIELESKAFSGAGDKNFPALGSVSATVSSSGTTPNLKTTNKTDYRDVKQTLGGEHTAAAYLLADGELDAGKRPSCSIPNVASWSWQKYGEPTDQISVKNGVVQNTDKLEDIAYDFTVFDDLEDGEAEDDQIVIDGVSLYGEARIFAKMWNTIKAKGGYMNTVSDGTVVKNVKVEYDAETQKYKIGPFKINYLEVMVNNKIFAGMTGEPKLVVSKDGANQTLTWGDDWRFVECSGDPYPHSGENYYIELDYKEGIEKIVSMQYFFKYLDAKGSATIYEGNMLTWNWNITGTVDWCAAGTCQKCDGAGGKFSKTSHDSPVTHYHGSGTNHSMGSSVSTGCNNYGTEKKCGHTSHTDCAGKDDATKCDHSCSGLGCGSGGYYYCKGHNCSGGKHTKHGTYETWLDNTQHLLTVKVKVARSDSDKIDIQDICHNEGSIRWYRGYPGEDTDGKTLTWNIDLTTMLEGDVWLDKDSDKGEGEFKDGNMESNEHGVSNVLVTVKVYEYNGSGDATEKGNAIAHGSDGKRISWPQVTSSGGHYKIERLEAPGIVSKGFYVVEFSYDGQVFESTVFLANSAGTADDTASNYMKKKVKEYEKKSMAVERVAERQAFDNKFTKIYGDSPMQNDNSTTGKSTSMSSIKYKGTSVSIDGVDGATMIKSEFESAAEPKHENMRSGWSGTYGAYGIKAYTYYKGGMGTTGANKSDYQILYPSKEYNFKYTMNANKDGERGYIDNYMRHINLGLKKRKETDISLLKDLYKMTVIVNEQEVVQDFNCLGPDNNTDIKANINSDYKTLKEVLETRRGSIKSNDLGLFTSDVTYSSASRYKNAIEEVQDIKKNTELRVFATYAVRIYNNSDTNNVKINEVIDYYDSTYTLIDKDTEASIVKESMERENKLVATKPYYRILSTKGNYTDIAWKPTREENLKDFKKEDGKSGDLVWNKVTGDATISNKMQKSKTESLKDIELKVNEYIEIFTTYEIDAKGFLTMSTTDKTDVAIRNDLFKEKNNIAEISNYSTFYSEKDMQKNNAAINFYKPYVKGQISGKIDKDSAPNNIRKSDILNIEKYEDDTCRAIPLNIALEKNERDMYGYVFEDAKTKNAGKYNIQTGDGIYDSTKDTLVPGVKVSMYEVISLGDVDSTESSNIEYNDLDYYYEVPVEFYKGTLTTEATTVNGVNGNYYVYGFLAGDYILRFDYGTKSDGSSDIYSRDGNKNLITNNSGIIKYNGQDYENTSFLSETTYGSGSETYTAINDKYLNLRTNDMESANGETAIKAVVYDTSKAYSVARDNESRRMVVDAFSRTIENGRGEMLRDRIASDKLYVEATSMFSETPIMQIEINDPKKLNDDTNLDDNQAIDIVKTIQGKKKKPDEKEGYVTTQKYSIYNINFGLEERAKTDIQLEEYIESILLMKDDDIIFSVMMDEKGNVKKTHEGTKNLDKLTCMTRNDIGNGTQQGFYAISVEDDYLNGLTMKIDYRIRIMNKSETDFTGGLSHFYTASEILNKAKYSPTTEEFTVKIEDWFKEEKDNVTNSTLEELLRLCGNEASDGILKELLGRNAKRIKGTGSDAISKNDTLRPDTIIYGKYVGRYYYENNIDEGNKTYIIKDYKSADIPNIEIGYIPDNVVRTTVNQLINYIDVNASYDLSTQNYENSAWDLSGNVEDTGTGIRRTIPSLDAIVSESSYREINGKSNIYDEKDKALVTDVSSNIVISKNNKMAKFNILSYQEYFTNDLDKKWVEYRQDYTDVYSVDNTNLDIGLVPESYKPKDSETNMWIMTTKTTASDVDANDLSFDNLVEVLVYSNPTGRRDVYSVPGNAMASATENGLWKAGYNSKTAWHGVGNSDEEYAKLGAKQWVSYPEDDAYAPEFVTIIAPTGIALRNYIKNIALPMAVLIIAIIVMVGAFGVKQIKIHKWNKED